MHLQNHRSCTAISYSLQTVKMLLTQPKSLWLSLGCDASNSQASECSEHILPRRKDQFCDVSSQQQSNCCCLHSSMDSYLTDGQHLPQNCQRKWNLSHAVAEAQNQHMLLLVRSVEEVTARSREREGTSSATALL